MFLGWLLLSLVLLYNANEHHRTRAISSSNALAGTLFTWRKAVTDYTSLKEVNFALANENAVWRSRHISNYARIAGTVTPIMDTLRRQQFKMITAKVVNSTWHKPKNFLTIDRGTLAGIHGDMGVIGSQGIVGVVRDASDHFASVISVLSPDIKTSVRLRHTGHFGLLYWDTNDPLTSSLIDIAKHARVSVGDTVETHGGDGIFPDGVMVGVVERVENEPGSNYHGITVRLSEDMTRSGFVYVVDDLLRTERDTLERAHDAP